MKTRYHIIHLIYTVSILIFSVQVIQSQNICLDFDGIDDFITAPFTNNAFTMEFWFQSGEVASNVPCNANQRQLLSLYNGYVDSHLDLVLCGNGNLLAFIKEDGSPEISLLLFPNNLHDQAWHHLSIHIDNNNNRVEFIVDGGTPVNYSNSNNIFHHTIHLGEKLRSNAKYFKGRIDNVKVFEGYRSRATIESEKYCPVAKTHGLFMYWNFDEGLDNGVNTGISQVRDLAPGGQNYGDLYGFNLIPGNATLIGGLSNFVLADNDIIYPIYQDADIIFEDYPYRNNIINSICNDDPVHFEINIDGNIPASNPNVKVKWYYIKNNIPVYLNSPPFTDYSFGVPQSVIHYDCSNSSRGYDIRRFFAEFEIYDPVTGSTCVQTSKIGVLKICCPLSKATVDITPSAPLCAGDSVNVQVKLNSNDVFVQNLSPSVSIDWFYNGTPINFQNQLSFNYTIITPTGISNSTNLCFEARVSNCGKSKTYQNCLFVDPKPICGTILAWPVSTPQNVTLISSTPHLKYEICPGDDAILGINPQDTFSNCVPQWQYSYDRITWSPLGLSNTIQNTNILPNATHPSIFYRIECQPLSNPSGCLPCYGNVIEITSITKPTKPIVTYPFSSCADSSVTYTVSNPQPGVDYVWYVNGQALHTGTSYTQSISSTSCIFVRATNQCLFTDSDNLCIDVCNVDVVLDYNPKPCVKLGETISLDACASSSSCPLPAITYKWYVDGVLQNFSACNGFTHIPAAGGTTYKVVVEDTHLGCTGSKEITIIPCDF